MIQTLKEKYWQWLRRRQRQQYVITPHPWMDAIARNLPAQSGPWVYVDGGAHHGHFAQEMAQRFKTLEIHAFEPVPDSYAHLTQTLQGLPAKTYPLALAAQSGKQTIHVNQSSVTCSLLKANANSSKYYGPQAYQTQAQVEIQTTSLDDWFAQAGLTKVDILKLDLQGYELQALRGAKKLLGCGVACVYVEVNFTPAYEGSALFSDVDLFMRSQGYKLFNLYNIWTYEQDWQIAGADALFIPDPAAHAMAKTPHHAAA
jgi:FkbM family methyltransferase